MNMTVAMNPLEMLGLLVAALGGAAVGLERQWSGHAEGPSARFAGMRTFAMLGAAGGLSGWLWTAGVTSLAGVLLAGATAVTIAAYVAASRQDVDGTTEVAALVVLAAGILSGMGLLRVASGIVAVEVLLLVEKSRLHSLVRRIDDIQLRAGVRFAVMALVILPLLPEAPLGPFQVRPRQLWLLVLFFSGLSFLGDVLRRVIGSGHGYLVSGAVGGLISSTNVTFTFARSSRSDPPLARALAFGTVAANAVLYLRVMAAIAVLNVALLPTLVPYLAAPALVAALGVAAGARRHADADSAPSMSVRNPLRLSAALQMAALFQLVLIIVQLAQRTWGRSGVLTTAAILGLTDVDALTVSMAREIAQTVSIDTAALAIAVGILANTALKTGVALFFGERQFRLIVAGALTLMMIAAAAAIGLMIWN
jgi:uncharacterized membrane protein (DUF4010 family)